MSDKAFTMLRLRRRFCRRIILMLMVFAVSFYASVLFFGDLKTPRVMHLTDLSRCPACYGVSVCPELYSHQVIMETSPNWFSMLNSKNIYYGFTRSSRKVVLKKLAHDWELKEFDSKMCRSFNLKRNCKPVDLLNVSDVDEKIVNLVQYNLTQPNTRPRKGLVFCPYSYSFYDFLKPLLNKGNPNYKSDVINVWTMLSINPEPIILQLISKSKGWAVPAYGGVCGRVEVVGHEGEPLSLLSHIAWHRKLKYANKILNAAMDFTYKHDRFRFYLMDWSLDNIVANEKDEVAFIDLEDIIILDKHISPKKDLPDWYQRYSREVTGGGFSFSIDKICKHHLSDHNIWAACYVLAGEEEQFLYPIPNEVNASRPHFDRLLKKCLNDGSERFSTITKLQNLISEMLLDENIVGFGASGR